jgi:hypothetical protein
MARFARLDVPNAPYHIINRAVGRLTIFSTPADYELFMDVLAYAHREWGQALFFSLSSHATIHTWPALPDSMCPTHPII